MVQNSYGKVVLKSYGREFPQILILLEEFTVSFLSLLVCYEEYSKKEDSGYLGLCMNIGSSELEELYCLLLKGLAVPSEVAEEADLEEDQASLQTSP